MIHGASKPLIFISDLHLQDKSPVLTNALVRFLAEQSGSCGALYILGDLFEVWLGDDARGSCVDTVSDALREFTQSGSKLFLMHGNRDFLIGNHSPSSKLPLVEHRWALNRTVTTMYNKVCAIKHA